MTRTHHIIASFCALVAALACSAAPAYAREPGAPCPNEQLRSEQPDASGLPDCRAYEMVSPLRKAGNGVTAQLGRAAESGEAIVYFAPGSFAEPQSSYVFSTYLSRRESGGWATQNLSPPLTDYVGVAVTLRAEDEELLLAPDLSRAIVETPWQSLATGQRAGYTNLYVADTATGSFEPVTTVQPEAEYKPFEEGADSQGIPEAEGASSDFSHVVFQQAASLCCGASSETQGHIYEEAGGVLRQIDVPPPGGKFEGDDNVGAAAGTEPMRNGDTWRAVSEDGSRVVFTGAEKLPIQSVSEGQVYVRLNSMSPEDCSVAADACTVEVSASQKTNGSGPAGTDPNAKQGTTFGTAFYRGASVDGSRVFFTSRVELTNNADTGPEDNNANLYEYNVETGVLTDLTPENTEGGGALGLVTAGENAGEENSYVYFVANGVLANNENANKETAKPGDCNEEETKLPLGEYTCSLYADHYEHGEWNTEFVATLDGGADGVGGEADEADWIGGESSSGDKDNGPLSHTVRVTPNGTTLAFESEQTLTSSYDNRQSAPGECRTGRCREVYLFDATTGKLICASCDPDGSRPVGPSRMSESYEATSYVGRNLSQSGGRLFFETPDALVTHDSNGLVDVYEWERAGEGTCTTASSSYTASHEGCTFPISDVAGSSESTFMDASVNGDDVFILTADQLAASDTDDRGDVYDVKVGGGFPVTVVPPPCTNADSCKPPPSPQPGVFDVPASATFVGPGNPAPPSPPPVAKAKTAAQLRAEKLAKALKACRRDRSEFKRRKCEKAARKVYAAKASRKAH